MFEYINTQSFFYSAISLKEPSKEYTIIACT